MTKKAKVHLLDRDSEAIGRSQSLEDLKYARKTGGTDTSFQHFIDDIPTENRGASSYPSSPRAKGAIDKGISDLDKMLRKKLDIVSSVLNVHNEESSISNLENANRSPYLNRSLIDTDLSNIELSPLDFGQYNSNPISGDQFGDSDSIDDDNDDEEFQNVDEIDGPIVSNPSSDSDSDSEIIDYNMPVNAAYRRSLEECAEKITNECGFKPSLQPRVEWYLEDSISLDDEISDWFTLADYSSFTHIHNAFIKHINNAEAFLTDETIAQLHIQKLLSNMNDNDESIVMCVAYISFGLFAFVEGKDDHLKYIKRNNMLLAEHLPEILKKFIEIADCCKDSSTNLNCYSKSLLYLSSVIYLITLQCIVFRCNKEQQHIVDKVIGNFDDADILSYLTKYIEAWRWNSRLSMRIRNIIMLLSKIILLQFGDIRTYKKTKKDLYKYHGLRKIENRKNKWTISPLQYEAFTSDIVTRYPSCKLPTTNLPKEFDKSNSLSQFLEIPRPKSKNAINITLNVPEQHIATPAPSPPSSPQLLHFNETSKGRKSFQTNLLYPCLYPSDNEEDIDELDRRLHSELTPKQTSESKIPFSIEEAATILAENLQIKLTTKQLWHERDLFMATERGWEEDNLTDPYDYSSLTGTANESLKRMIRVDNFYKECFTSLNSLVFVLLQTIELNLTNQFTSNAEDVDENTLLPQLELTKAKESSLKSSVELLFMLMKWFKLSHILKFEQLGVILYDSQFINICSAVLGKYSDIYGDRIFNRIITSNKSFWSECSKYNFEYKNSFRYVHQVQKAVNLDFLPSLAYLLRILQKVVGNKTQRIKELPQSIGTIVKKYYHIFNLDIYHPLLKIIKELTPFKNKRWKSEHMELISGVFLYEKLELIDNWVAGKDITGELSDAYGQEIALRALLQFYNFEHYQVAMEDLGYQKKNNSIAS